VNGQQKIAVIVGYDELIKRRSERVSMPDITTAWKHAKFDGKPDATLLARAIKGGLLREPENDKTYDLTRKGEAYFHSVVESIEGDSKND
ncbi:MAG TPA: hypothetical protein VHL10_03775, partial [Nitrososphaera sp.]|nr:hypothetical protein [Nitrososphaera sp.]